MADWFELTVSSARGPYPVVIGQGAFADRVGGLPQAIALVDTALADQLDAISFPVIGVEVDETNKTLPYCERLIAAVKQQGGHRGSHLVAVGGGMVQDVATLVASLYMRGIAWTYIPTTLMAMADSCIGGKSSINVGTFKNLVGNIYPPAQVVVDPRFAETLSPEAVAGGLCEAVKICYCRGDEAFAEYLARHAAYASDPTALGDLLHHVLGAKAWFVEVDEFDRAERRLLNFGHTFAHAIESASAFGISHGVAVGVGVLAALAYAGEAQSRPPSPAEALLGDHCRQLLRGVPGLVERLVALDGEAFANAFAGDKKHEPGAAHLILPNPDGGVNEVVHAPKEHAVEAARRALDQAIGALR